MDGGQLGCAQQEGMGWREGFALPGKKGSRKNSGPLQSFGQLPPPNPHKSSCNGYPGSWLQKEPLWLAGWYAGLKNESCLGCKLVLPWWDQWKIESGRKKRCFLSPSKTASHSQGEHVYALLGIKRVQSIFRAMYTAIQFLSTSLVPKYHTDDQENGHLDDLKGIKCHPSVQPLFGLYLSCLGFPGGLISNYQPGSRFLSFQKSDKTRCIKPCMAISHNASLSLEN